MVLVTGVAPLLYVTTCLSDIPIWFAWLAWLACMSAKLSCLIMIMPIGQDQDQRTDFLRDGNSVLLVDRYRIQDRRLSIVHESATCKLWRTHDIVGQVPVAVKVMGHAQHLRAELIGRQGLDTDCVLGAIRFHVPVDERDEWRSHFNNSGHAGCYLAGYTKTSGRTAFASLSSAAAACLDDSSAGGVTQEGPACFTVRAGDTLLDSPSAETSWLQCDLEASSSAIDKGELTEFGEEPSADDTKGNTYVLVLPWAERSLDNVIGMERIAGYKVDEIQEVLRAVISGVQHMHEHGILHGDIKPKVGSCLLQRLYASHLCLPVVVCID